MTYRNKKIRFRWLVVLLGFLGFVFLLTLSPYTGEYTYERSYNLIPFKSISNYYYYLKNNGFANGQNGITAIFNLLGNIALLLPFGFLLPLTVPGRIKAKHVMISSFLLSAFIEITQYLVLVSRRADIDDIIFNVISALIGYLLYRVICFRHYKMYKDNPPGRGTKYFHEKK